VFLKRIVVGEDEDALAQLVQMALGDAGYLCLRGRNGEEALALAQSQSPDLLILDILMPRLDGIETVKRLKADPVHSKVPVLMLTSLAEVEDKVRGLDAGADDYLAKPFDLRELVARVRALVRHNRRERDRSPTTDLPGPGTLEEALTTRLTDGPPFALLFLELVGFEHFVVAHGWMRGDALAADTALALRGAAAPRSTLTHLGGGDFALIAEPGEAAALSAVLERAVAEALSGAQSAEGELRVQITRVDSGTARTVDDLSRELARRHAR
jgi:PleD family two-component response regulator